MGMREEKVYLMECERSGPHLEIPYRNFLSVFFAGNSIETRTPLHTTYFLSASQQASLYLFPLHSKSIRTNNTTLMAAKLAPPAEN